MFKKYKYLILTQYFKLVEMMALMFCLAVVSVIALPVYRASLTRRYENEVIRAMSFIKTAQDRYYAKHGLYAGLDKIHSATEDIGLGLSEEDFPDMRHVDFDNLVISVNYPLSDEFLIVWLGYPSGDTGLKIQRMAMDHRGRLYKSSAGSHASWMPEFPHKQHTD